jgi:hypothetical protein
MHMRDRQTGRPETKLKTERETGFQANPTPTPAHTFPLMVNQRCF